MKREIAFILSFVLFSAFTHGQSENESSIKAYGNMTVYFIDNSSGYEASELNGEMKEELKNNLNKLLDRSDNYFFIYACNGEEPKMSNNLGMVTDPSKSFLKKYLSRDSEESEYGFDKTSYRENLVDYPVRIKQNLEVNIYLSSYAIKRLMSSAEELPAPLTLSRELPIYLRAEQLKVRINIFINKEAAEQFGVDAIRSYFLFCDEELGNQKAQVDIQFL